MSNKRNMKSEQRGTLLIEALAMLGLIAMVTPTLYKKSAERMFEIQDINVASQMRTLNSVIETFVKSNSGSLNDEMEEGTTREVCYNDNSANCYAKGYSSMVPFGFNLDSTKNFRVPRVFVYKGRDDSSGYSNLLYYIVYNKDVDVGAKRASRLASLIGSNGGVVDAEGDAPIVKGTGGSWNLDNDMIKNDLAIEDALKDGSVVSKNSIVISAQEPILIQETEDEEYLVRVPASDGNYFKNTMITDLFMGAPDINTTTGYQNNLDRYSIFNVRKLTLNTDCSGQKIRESSSIQDPDVNCNPNVADLYIGKPTALTKNPAGGSAQDKGSRQLEGNTGAAWFYGNLSALNDNFRVFRSKGEADWRVLSDDLDRDASSGAYDVMEFARVDNSHTIGVVDSSSLSVFMADNNPTNARVRMMNGFVEVAEKLETNNHSTAVAFLVGEASEDDSSKGGLIRAYYLNEGASVPTVEINRNYNSNAITEINPYGGTVHINSKGSSAATANTYINAGGGAGSVAMGKDGDWFKATGDDDSARVAILQGSTGSGIFSVGTKAEASSNAVGNMLWANNIKTSLRGDRLRVYDNNTMSSLATSIGGTAFLSHIEASNSGKSSSGATFITTPLTDIFGSLYVGDEAMQSSVTDNYEAVYSRKDWQMGVAGSAWVDDMLWARRAWLNSGGMAELHAGHSSFVDFNVRPNIAWLNVYPGKSSDAGVIIRNAADIKDNTARFHGNDVLFRAYSAGVGIWDATHSSWAGFEEGSAWVAAKSDMMVNVNDSSQAAQNLFAVDKDSARVQGVNLVNIYTVDAASSGVVNVQGGAIEAAGSPRGSSEELSNKDMENHIIARGKWFGIRTNDSSSAFDSSAGVDGEYTHFRVGEGVSGENGHDAEVRVKYADFAVRASKSADSSSSNVNLARFYVRPDNDPINNADANVKVDGSLHVTGNNVIHIATHEANASGGQSGEQHAMFEVDPNYLQVMEMKGDSTFVNGTSTSVDGGYRAMFRVNPFDIDGEATSSWAPGSSHVANASVYVRKGAIELMASENNGKGDNGTSTYGADEGFGYIKANRFVSNTGVELNSSGIAYETGYTSPRNPYDQYMVNPAYTSVMHDIKLTTRGGARLSDILPDYILKGVYNVSNDFLEGSKTDRVSWSCGGQCGTDKPYNGMNENTYWANPYVGVLPYAVCPPTYKQFATLVPISFMMGISGEIKLTKDGNTYGYYGDGTRYVIDFENPRQAAVLQTKKEIDYPGMAEVEVAKVYSLGSDYVSSLSNVFKESSIAGWFRGYKANEYSSGIEGSMEKDSATTAWIYKENNTAEGKVIAEPLYFQQNTWLKTSVVPNHTNAGMTGWAGYMGFVYDTKIWNLGTGEGDEGMASNNASEYNDGNSTVKGFYGYGNNTATLVWNLFPTPTNSIEGHGTVYCYFDRSVYENWTDSQGQRLVDPIDQMNSYREKGSKSDGRPETKEYIKRLHDPSLKYDDPW